MTCGYGSTVGPTPTVEDWLSNPGTWPQPWRFGPGPGGPAPQSPQRHPEQRSEGLECGTSQVTAEGAKIENLRKNQTAMGPWASDIFLATLATKSWLISTMEKRSIFL